MGFWKPTKRHQSLTLEASDVTFKAASTGDGPAPVEITAYNGGLMTVPGFGPVVVDLGGLELSPSVTLLSDHDATRKGVVGAGTAETRDGKLIVRGSVSRTSEAGREIIGLHQDGVKWQASVGVQPRVVETIRGGQTIEANGRTVTAPKGGMKFVRSGLLRETTITALGCDNETAVAIAAANGKANAMTVETTETSTPNSERIETINAMSRDNLGAHQDRVDEARLNAIAGDISVDEFKTVVLEATRASRSSAPRGGSSGSGGLTPQHIEAAVLVKYGRAKLAAEEYGEAVVMRASRMRTHLDFARAALQIEVRDVPDDPDEMLRAAAVSNATLPVALGNAANKVALLIYRDAPATWRTFCDIRSTPNFKDNSAIRPSFLGAVQPIAPDGELKHGTIAEAVFTWAVLTFGKVYGVTRTDLQNDDTDVFSQIIPGMTQAYVRQQSDLTWKTILDSTTHFTGARNNLLTGAGSALSLTSLEDGITAMRKQTDSEGNTIDMQPSTLVVPPELVVTAKQILNSTEIRRAVAGTTDVDVTSPTGNALQGALNLEVEPRISNTDAFANASLTQWYLFARPVNVPAVAGFLNGRQQPIVKRYDVDATADKLVAQFKIYGDFGFSLGDYRAGLKSAGA